MTKAASSNPLIEGTVESISKQAIVVTLNGVPTTLQGTKVEQLAPTLKLGDVVEIDDASNIQVIQKKGEKKATTTRRAGNSPAGALPTMDKGW